MIATTHSHRYQPKTLALASFFTFILLALVTPPARAQNQTIDDQDRQRIRQMLTNIKTDLKKNYYDPTFRGIDLDAHFKAAEEKAVQASSLVRAYRIMAQALIDLNDSHTYFDPPVRPVRVDYGWQMLMIGDKCYLTGIKPKSNAEEQGLKPGDQIVSLDGYEPTRADLWKMKYVYYLLSPRRGLRMVVQSPDGKQRQLDVMAKIYESRRVLNLDDPDVWTDFEQQDENTKHLNRHRHYAEGDLFIWKMPQFDDAASMDDMMSKARKYRSLIIDLRGNGGGDSRALERLVGYFFEQDLKIADLKGRKEMKPMLAKTQGRNAFQGKLVVLVDSETASAAEVFARVIQLEKRGTVLGDATMGAVMGSKYYGHQLGTDRVAFYGASITEVDLIMKDGASLERIGVNPNEKLLPTGLELSTQRDPVLARAAALLGVQVTPEKAGSLFPMEWLNN
jgi:C-terminal processing protease CtpA/Prc